MWFGVSSREGRTIVLVTHDMRQVEEFCDRVVLLDHGHLVGDGEPGKVIADFRERLGHPPEQADWSPPVEVVDVRAEAVTLEGITSVTVTATFSGNADDFEARVVLETEGGGPLVTMSSAEAGIALGIDGERTLRFEVPGLALSTGEYRVEASAAARDSPRPWHTGSTRLPLLAVPWAGPLVAPFSVQEQ